MIYYSRAPRACSSAVRAPSLYLGGRWFKSIQAHHRAELDSKLFSMPFLFIGVILLVISIIMLRKALKLQNKELIVGLSALIIASVVMILFFGIFYNLIAR